jgi:hypothetical protein
MQTLARLAMLSMLTVALTTVTFAANNKNEGNFTLPDAARVGSTELRAGDYKAEWQAESGDAVKVEFLQNGKTVATVEGKLKDLQQAAPYNAIVTKQAGDNAQEINEIDFNNRRQALVFGE